MGLKLSGELVSVLGMLGYDWPETDEEKLFGMAGSWFGFAGRLGAPVGEAQDHAAKVWSQKGEGLEAFRRKWTGEDAPAEALTDAGTAAMLIGAGLTICAVVVLMLKIYVIIQLVLLLFQIIQAIAWAGPTFGASLSWIPIAKFIASVVIDQLIDMTVESILNG
ncbi:hypothetical protein GCM10009678_48230 [Actinomadura kijaniata]|uniref:Outer membrane channel protein CpnT-like N-terminal domain-containing protein n=1 Tax=Actinomadura namibiensis TaxID=182080 RepID=A0A7W3QQQ3_ACTNM|nr:hypothetical protein [Actinomadura namibiensis]MBA8955528.1 hypothetical protein [Actinomadura namibiensis]